MTTKTEDIFQLSSRIKILPTVHGSGDFARTIRQKLLEVSPDCLAVCLPEAFQPLVEEGIDKLPYISLVSSTEPDGSFNYVPIDPCQSVITALRVAMQEGIPRKFIDWDTSTFETRKNIFPDTFALRNLSYEKFATALLPTVKKPAPDSFHDKRIRWMAYQIHKLELDYSNIALVCSILDWPWIKEAYDANLPYPQGEEKCNLPSLFGLETNTLFFALSEIPYVTHLYEKKRQELRPDREAALDGVKEILLKARDLFTKKHKVKYHNLTPQTFQIFLQYVRNLSLMENRLTPDLYTLANTAKQVGGDSFAVCVVEAARDYPFQEEYKKDWDTLALGIDQALLDDKVVKMKNRLSEFQVEWKNIDLKKDPDADRQKEWKYNWNPHGQCSWPPEDDQIESLNTHVREQSKLLLSSDLARTEKFTSSVKDGLDIRETIRNWHTGDIYVKEIPPSRGRIEIVVLLFEVEPDPAKFSWRQTWYAEHLEESTLCFFATPYEETLIGPGIAQANYGGCMLMYPPRPIPNIWEDRRLKHSATLDERLLEAAFFHSREKHVTVASPGPPTAKWRLLAKRYKKRIIHIPLSRFSNQTIEKVRRFHVLNGKEIRSFASRFIEDI